MRQKLNVVYLSWIIPTYNEERRIEKGLREVHAYLLGRLAAGVINGYEIIVVDSSSPDATGAIVRRLAAEILDIELLTVENRGKGWGVKQGMLRAKGDIRLFSDADNSTAPEHFDRMAPLFRQGFDVVISSRDPKDAPGASRDVKEPWYREILGNLGNLLIQAFGVWGIWDTQNGFKALTSRAAETIFSQIRIAGFAFDIELLALARRLEYRIAIVPVSWVFDPDSKLTLEAYLQVFLDVFRIRWNLIIGKYEI